ncbi:MAG TPA: fumarylacetoacetate hydrolase family protein [Candidatus Acidoferrales bacterium]|nr:fumarylacetoacetate hydrolase family protein [Candidatus Acidoferrales bacterium]
MSEQRLRLYRTDSGYLVEHNGCLYPADQLSWDALIARDDLHSWIADLIRSAAPSSKSLDDFKIRAPIGNQEVWAAGVTYFRSRDARMEESKSAGGGDFYDRVYSAERPELFFKATANRVVGHGERVAIRSDAKWSVPEPELVLLISASGKILGYTIGNDMSSRDIEGENPLYLPQAKVYNRSCALGPCILVSPEPISRSTEIRMEILRASGAVFAGSVKLNAIKREFTTLVEFLYRDNTFPNGCFLFTGTGIVPPDSFTLQRGDEICIAIEGIGTLINSVG